MNWNLQKKIFFFLFLISYSSGESIYENSNAYCSQTPTIYPFVGGHQLDGIYTLIRYSAVDYSGLNEETPKCGNLSITSVPPESSFMNIENNKKTFVSMRTHPFDDKTFYKKTIDVIQTNAIITPGRWISMFGLFQFIVGPLGKTRSLMFLKYTMDWNYNNVESFLYANCGMHPNGGITGPGCGVPSMSEWGIMVRIGFEHLYQDENYLSKLYNEALLEANLPLVSNMTIIESKKCF